MFKSLWRKECLQVFLLSFLVLVSPVLTPKVSDGNEKLETASVPPFNQLSLACFLLFDCLLYLLLIYIFFNALKYLSVDYPFLGLAPGHSGVLAPKWSVF